MVYTEPASARMLTPSRRSSLATTVFDRRDIPELQFSMEDEEEARGEELSGWTGNSYIRGEELSGLSLYVYVRGEEISGRIVDR